MKKRWDEEETGWRADQNKNKEQNEQQCEDENDNVMCTVKRLAEPRKSINCIYPVKI